MTRTIHTLCAAALLLAATACEDTLQTAAPNPGNGPTITLCIDNDEEGAQTRTNLTNADPTNNVQAVRILIFQGGTEANNYNDATYVDEEDIADGVWPGPEVTRYEYTLNYAFVDGQTYTLLGVGMDDKFSDTYAIDQNKTLGETYARLKEEATPAQCEFFTGTVSFTQAGKNTQIDDLHLRRRVAGAMLYVKEIPQELVENDGNTYRVTSVRLYLGSAQNTSVRLKRSEEGREPDGQTPGDEASKLLTSVTVPDGIYDAQNDFYKDGNAPLTLYSGVYMLPLNRTENTPTFTVQLWGKQDNKDGTLADEEQALSKTFVVENRSEGSATSFDIRSNYIYCIGKKSQNTDQPISLGNDHILLEVRPWKEITPNVDFDEARIQAIFDPDFDEEKYRFNCINGTFTVRVLPSLFQDRWTLTIPNTTTAYDKDFTQTEFTTAGDNPTMTHWLYILTDDAGHLSKTGTKAETTYQCTLEEAQNGAEVTFVMLDYAVYRPWGWVNHQWQPTPDDITRINNDVRSIEIMLQTDRQITGEDGNRTTSPRYDYLPITQYNTITVDFTHQDKYNDDYGDETGPAICGFSRIDLGDRFVPYPTETSIVENDPAVSDESSIHFPTKTGSYKSFGFGWWSTYPGSTGLGLYRENNGRGSRTDGASNIKELGKKRNSDTWAGIWNGCASQECEVRFRRVEGEQLEEAQLDGDQTTDACWYLPAQFEMEGLFYAAFQQANMPNTNLAEKTDYWTSTVALPTSDYSSTNLYCAFAMRNQFKSTTPYPSIIIDRGLGYFGDDEDEQDDHNMSGSYVYLRQARKFTQYYNGSDWATLPDGQQQ